MSAPILNIICLYCLSSVKYKDLFFRPQKAGRALFNAGPPPVQTPSVIQYYTNPEQFGAISSNSITSSGIPVPHLDGSTNQWHTHSVVTSPDEENCGLSKVK